MAVYDLSREGELRRRRMLVALLVLGFLVVSLLVSDERRLFGGRAMPRAFAALAAGEAPRASSVTSGPGGLGSFARTPAPGARGSGGAGVPIGGAPAIVPGAPTLLADTAPQAVAPQVIDGESVAGVSAFGISGPDDFFGGSVGGFGGGGFVGGGGGGLVPDEPATLPPAVPGVPSSGGGIVPALEAPVPGAPILDAAAVTPVALPRAEAGLPAPRAPLAPPVINPSERPVSPVPEPATWLMLGVGTGAIGTALRRARRRRAIARRRQAC